MIKKASYVGIFGVVVAVLGVVMLQNRFTSAVQGFLGLLRKTFQQKKKPWEGNQTRARK